MSTCRSKGNKNRKKVNVEMFCLLKVILSTASLCTTFNPDYFLSNARYTTNPLLMFS